MGPTSAIHGASSRTSAGCVAGCTFDCRKNARICSAAADVAVHGAEDLFFLGRVVVAEERRNAHDHAGGAIATLKCAFVKKCLLDGGELAILLEAFDGGDLRARSCCRGY